MYTKEAIRAANASALPDLLQRGKSSGAYICPVCQHEKVGRPKGPMWRCFRCNAHGDAVNILMLRGMDQIHAFLWVMSNYGPGTRGDREQAMNASALTTNEAPAQEPALNAGSTSGDQRSPRRKAGWAVECRNYCQKAIKALPGSAGEEYMHSRRFTQETLRRFRIGFDENATAHGSTRTGQPAVIIPYSPSLSYYEARFLPPVNNGAKYLRPRVRIAGQQPIYNEAALTAKTAETIIVVEGIMDALAVMQAAASERLENVYAVSLGGANSKHGALCKALSSRASGDQPRILIALDNDEAGRSGALDLAKKLETAGLGHRFIGDLTCFMAKPDASCQQMTADVRFEKWRKTWPVSA